SAALVRYEVGAGVLLPPVGGARYRVGLGLDGRRATFVEDGASAREVFVGGTQLMVHLEWVRGEY
ncbi:MAG: hypothetical protein ABMB14_06680, partial [Myxococcota bacterium]